MLTTTLNRIRAHKPCEDGWSKLLAGLGKRAPDDEPLPYARIVEINGIKDAIWACRAEHKYAKEWRLFAVACARDASQFTNDWCVIHAINVAERYAHGMASCEELKIAHAAYAAADPYDTYAAHAAAAHAAAAHAADAAHAAYAADAAHAAHATYAAAAHAADAAHTYAAHAATYAASAYAATYAASAYAAHAATYAASAYASAYDSARISARQRQTELFLQIVS